MEKSAVDRENAEEVGPEPLVLGSGPTASPVAGSGLPLTWENWREALRVVMHRPHLQKTTLIALGVGSILFAINHLDVVLRGQATREVWARARLLTWFRSVFQISAFWSGRASPKSGKTSSMVGLCELSELEAP